MRHKLAIAIVLCLAAMALLGVGAAPAAAATCSDCHAAPDGPPAPDCATFVVGVDCATCHKNMSPHGTEYATPQLGLRLEGDTLKGGLHWAIHIPVHPWYPGERAVLGIGLPIPNVVVYLQQRLWGTSDWTDLAQVTTTAGTINAPNYSYALTSPTPWAAYRAVAEGGLKSEGVVRRPVQTVWLPRATLTLELGGVTDRVLPFGQTVQIHGDVAPTELAGKVVTVKTMRRNLANTGWIAGKTMLPTIGATGSYSCAFTPRYHRAYRVTVSVAATPDSLGRAKARIFWVK
jgi:hypothetical protein